MLKDFIKALDMNVFPNLYVLTSLYGRAHLARKPGDFPISLYSIWK